MPPEQSLRAEVVPGGKPRGAGLAVGRLGCGICTLLLFPLFFLFMIPAIVCGHVAQARIKQAKGALVGGILGERDAIADSDEGQSFRAFWEVLMSQARQEQMTGNLERVLAQPDAVVGAATDDASLVEAAGGTVVVVPTSPENLKVTPPLDLELAELPPAAR